VLTSTASLDFADNATKIAYLMENPDSDVSTMDLNMPPSQTQMSNQHHMLVNPSPEEERMLKRKRRLIQNRKSAALSRSRKKEYLLNLEKQNSELKVELEKFNTRLQQYVNQEWELKNRIEESELIIKHLREENDILKQKLGIPIDGESDRSK
jgi:hypothetical protein